MVSRAAFLAAGACNCSARGCGACPDARVGADLEAETTPTKAVYATPDGSLPAKLSTAPVRFKDASGKWVDFDLTIVARSDGSLGAEAAPNAATLSAKADGGVVTVPTSAGPVVLRHPGAPQAAAVDKAEATDAQALSAGRQGRS